MFNDLISNSHNSWGIILYLHENKKFDVTFESCQFKKITLTNLEHGYCAISYTKEGKNTEKSLTIKGCQFSEIYSSLNRGAIFFNENSKTCLIEDSKFEQTKTDQNDCAICFQFKQDQAPVIINRCHFIRTTSNKSGAVYIECNKDGSKSQKFVQIDSCEFTSATATDNGNSIYIIQSDLDEFKFLTAILLIVDLIQLNIHCF